MVAHRKPRSYDASRRREAAEHTRHAILQAAHACFVANGWAGTTMAAIARDADVALDTVYAAVGTKSALLRLLIERALSGVDEPVPAGERAYVKAIGDAPDAPTKIARYAAALRNILPRLAPLVHVLQAASGAEPELNALWREISERRARNMRLFAADLAKTGALRPDLSVEEAADVVWAMNSPELYLLLVDGRGWTPERYERWLSDSWRRLLLR
ncbi:MAG TPA: TetR/AcrR family transcriptional regulator [Anaeromyxobacteraceae bacterium]|nr:TetR/AcrR family transcriptional regulator [Anaeromyxobacteraceae bacterium]